MNKSILTRFFAITLLAGGATLSQAAISDSPGLPPAATKHWTADNGQNPIISNCPVDSIPDSFTLLRFSVSIYELVVK